MNQPTFRLFFALWPDNNTRRSLASAARQINPANAGRPVPDYNLHMTLHFIGNVGPKQANCLRQQAEHVIAQPFSVQIDRYGQFAGPRVTWLGCSRIPHRLMALHLQLGEQISDNQTGCGYAPERRKYQPHVSVFRKAPQMPVARLEQTIDWPVTHFSLIRSLPDPDTRGVRYQEWQRYPLSS